jgi:ADP-ribosylglycohydrolase
VVEAEPPEVARAYVDDWLRASRAAERSSAHHPFGQYTDDTQLARELLRSFQEQRGWNPAAFALRVAHLFEDGRDVGAGRGTRSAALRLLTGVHWSEAGTPAPYAGNGSAMRAGPLGLLFADDASVSRAAREQSRITHLDPRCAAGAVAISRAVWLAAGGAPLEPAVFLEDLAAAVEPDDVSVARAIRGLEPWLAMDPVAAAGCLHESGLDCAHPGWQGISAFVTPSILWSLYAFLHSPDDYWETICTAIGVGGDTDTMAAMAGAISGARLGPDVLPYPLLCRLNDRGEWRAEALGGLARDCAAIVDEVERSPVK